MTDKELKRLALAGEPVPNGLSQANQLFYLSLRELCRQFLSGNIDKAQANAEQKRLKRARDEASNKDARIDQHLQKSAEMWKNIELASMDFKKARLAHDDAAALEAADRIHNSIYGL